MKGLKNLFHGVILLGWALLGAMFTLKCAFGGGPFVPGLLLAGSYWLWFAGLAAVTTWLVSRFEKPASALLAHFAVFLFLAAVPRLFPLNLLRLGLDLLAS